MTHHHEHALGSGSVCVPGVWPAILTAVGDLEQPIIQAPFKIHGVCNSIQLIDLRKRMPLQLDEFAVLDRVRGVARALIHRLLVKTLHDGPVGDIGIRAGDLNAAERIVLSHDRYRRCKFLSLRRFRERRGRIRRRDRRLLNAAG